ncbi:MAG: ABC transporter substrate-binding protein [Tepidiformaceae bacterium]
MADYWDKYWQSRSSRRRFLGTAGAAGVGAAGLALVGCGDDDDDKGGASSLATATPGAAASPTSADPLAGVKRGGVYKTYATGDPPSIDPYGNLSFLTKGTTIFAYSRLFKYKTDPKVASASVLPTPDLAASAEASADGLKYTVKLRPGVKFHNVAPVNGRAITTDDVKFSWGRATAATNTNATQLAFVDKVEYPDAATIVFTLKAPNAAFLDILADTNLLQIMPTEAEGKYDPAKLMIGSGPWVFDSYKAGEKFVYKKNPDWYEKGYPLMDGVEVAIIPEYANRKAQFLAGALDVTDLNAEDLVSTRDQVKGLQIYGELPRLLSFFYFDSDPASPVADPRVRQAISMCIDRDALTDLGYNTKKLKAAGLDVKTGWNNLIPAGFTRYWLDPQGKDIGDTAKYFKYNLAEAKKLMEAAGKGAGFEIKYQYVQNRYGTPFDNIAEAQIGYLAGIGIKANVEVQDYSAKYITQTFAGNFTGIAFGYETPFPEGGSYPLRHFTDNPLNHGRIKDAELTKLATDQQAAPTEEKRKALFWDIQRKNAEKMYYVPSQAGAATGWEGHQPWEKNLLYQTIPYGAPTEELPYRWSDKA